MEREAVLSGQGHVLRENGPEPEDGTA